MDISHGGGRGGVRGCHTNGVVFLRKVKTASGATSVQVAERKNRRDVVLEHLGSAHTETELAALLSAGRDKINAGQEVLDPGLSQDPQSAVIHSKKVPPEIGCSEGNHAGTRTIVPILSSSRPATAWRTWWSSRHRDALHHESVRAGTMGVLSRQRPLCIALTPDYTGEKLAPVIP